MISITIHAKYTMRKRSQESKEIVKMREKWGEGQRGREKVNVITPKEKTNKKKSEASVHVSS